MEQPTKKERPKYGDEIEVTVGDLAFGGRGVARADGFVVFAPDTAPGDVALVRLRKVRRRFAEADLVEVLTPGPGACRWSAHSCPTAGDAACSMCSTTRCSRPSANR